MGIEWEARGQRRTGGKKRRRIGGTRNAEEEWRRGTPARERDSFKLLDGEARECLLLPKWGPISIVSLGRVFTRGKPREDGTTGSRNNLRTLRRR